jgi:hypothetical protein
MLPPPWFRAPQPDQRPLVTIHPDGGSVMLEVGTRLDAETGAELLAATSAALLMEPDRIAVNLRGLESWTEEGARALVRCRELCADLPDGLYYRTGRGPGRDALLTAYS